MVNVAICKNILKFRAHFQFILVQILIAIFCFASSVAQQDTLRVATYNLLFFPGMDSEERIPHFRTVVDAVNPDILIVQELESQTGLNTFLSEVMNHDGNVYQSAPFVDGPFTDSGLFLNTNKVSLLGISPVPNMPFREVIGYFLSAFGEEFIIYSCHFKAGSEPADLQTRLSESTILRNHLNQLSTNTNFLLAGDFNMRSASESAFIKLTEDQADNDGKLFDPINQVGDWHNNSFFALTHTQATRTTVFGDGAGGGLDDRFDMILVSNSLLGGGGMDVLTNTYRAFGNDGNKVNEAVNSGVNLVVPDSVADALHLASDHLPVVVDFVFGHVTSVEDFGVRPRHVTLHQNYPNPFNAGTTIQYHLSDRMHVLLSVFDLLGREVAVLVDGIKPAGVHHVNWQATDFSSGIYFYKLSAGRETSTGKLILMK